MYMNDNKTIDFFMAMKPPTTTFQAKQINWKNKSIFDSAEAKNARDKLEANLAKHKLDEPLTGAIRMTAIWCYQTEDENIVGEPKVSKPDLDNMNKLLADSMTKLKFFKDDSQITTLILEKYWSDVPGIYIKLEQI